MCQKSVPGASATTRYTHGQLGARFSEEDMEAQEDSSKGKGTWVINSGSGCKYYTMYTRGRSINPLHGSAQLESTLSAECVLVPHASGGVTRNLYPKQVRTMQASHSRDFKEF